ncbi:ArnT family glycosyltransferase [Pontibacter sp. MBLB2868]|uniref:ArnT family glycosyltransferase n=1 Tax=Pontibacter sp. MBLB2868 TaxID=3451555 RepID=UPI003F75636C
MFDSNTLRSGRVLSVLLLLMFLVLIYNLGGWGVIETSEARYAEISREMWQTGNWFHPRLLGIQHFHKPPVTYIISAIGMGIFGQNAFGARFFLQLSLIAQVCLVYQIGKILFADKKQALVAAIIFLTIPAVLLAARNLTTDSFLTTFELAAIWCWLKYKQNNSVSWLYLFYLLLAFGFQTKGPVALIFPVLVVIGYGNRALPEKKPAAWHHLPGILLFLLVGASWFIYLMLQNSAFADYFLFKHTVERYTNPEAFGRSKPWWFYLVLAPALSLPWAAILIAKIRKLKELPSPLKRLFILWLLVPMVFFSISSSKLILYILPLFAGQALLTAWLLFQLHPETVQQAAHWSIGYLLILAAALLLAPLLPVGIALPGWALLFPALMLVSLLVILRSHIPHLHKLLTGVLVFTFLLVPYSTHFMGSNSLLINSSRSIAEFVEQQNLQERQIIVYNQLLPSLAFELNRDIISVEDGNSNLNREVQFEGDQKWRKLLLQLERPQDVTRFQRLLRQKPVLVVKDELPKEKEWMTANFSHKQQSGKWWIYY